jgi:hypothetical protein
MKKNNIIGKPLKVIIYLPIHPKTQNKKFIAIIKATIPIKYFFIKSSKEFK